MKDENRLFPLSFLFTGVFPLLGREQKVDIQPNFSALSSKFVIEETLQLLPQTQWHLLKPPINFISL